MISMNALLSSTVFSFMGIVVFVAGFILVDRLTPYSLWKEIVEKQNTAVAILVGCGAIALGSRGGRCALGQRLGKGERQRDRGEGGEHAGRLARSRAATQKAVSLQNAKGVAPRGTTPWSSRHARYWSAVVRVKLEAA